ncbi:MAG: bifunctional ADP-dependent NAD(P)H-hydrate dehydratase/NAD(P)H-hydrate epimerase [Bacteroidetes bacterium]|nr:MAG: bifunctional ADP-dependent NAD(P)H-hydrate dehydratase/NAD(P)H-hydrate epimerase [Bacteroidota bacterium]
MKILNVSQIRATDKFTIDNEPIKSIDLMERAATACFDWLRSKFDTKVYFQIYCGPGNNGGDGLAIARLLLDAGYSVKVIIVRYSDKSSEDFDINLKRLDRFKDLQVNEFSEGQELPEISNEDCIIDALFGSGLSKPIEGIAAKIIDHINQFAENIVAIDIPSGLFCDKRNDHDTKIRANHTLSFQLPKFSFLLPENFQFVGHWYILPIGLNAEFIVDQKTSYYYVDKHYVQQQLKPRQKTEHKGNFGHALLISGSKGKMGAAVLASRACLKSGTGLLTVHVPECGYDILQSTVPEAMASVDINENYFSNITLTQEYDAIGIGPGLSMDVKTQEGFHLFSQNIDQPLVIDADGINILGKNKQWISELPLGCILTPHPKEFERIAGKFENDYERHELAKIFVKENDHYLILKGAHTAIYCPDGQCYFNSTGNPGMATAGSGDTLTGIILGLLAQGYTQKESCISGVYLHGLAGDYAACKNSQEAMIASDIIENLGSSFLEVLGFEPQA